MLDVDDHFSSPCLFVSFFVLGRVRGVCDTVSAKASSDAFLAVYSCRAVKSSNTKLGAEVHGAHRLDDPDDDSALFSRAFYRRAPRITLGSNTVFDEFWAPGR